MTTVFICGKRFCFIFSFGFAFFNSAIYLWIKTKHFISWYLYFVTIFIFLTVKWKKKDLLFSFHLKVTKASKQYIMYLWYLITQCHPIFFFMLQRNVNQILSRLQNLLLYDQIQFVILYRGLLFNYCYKCWFSYFICSTENYCLFFVTNADFATSFPLQKIFV